MTSKKKATTSNQSSAGKKVRLRTLKDRDIEQKAPRIKGGFGTGGGAGGGKKNTE
jgi:hypothetical protein